MQGAVPNVGDFAREQAPRRRPIRDLVVLNFVLPGRVIYAAPVTPGEAECSRGTTTNLRSRRDDLHRRCIAVLADIGERLLADVQ